MDSVPVLKLCKSLKSGSSISTESGSSISTESGSSVSTKKLNASALLRTNKFMKTNKKQSGNIILQTTPLVCDSYSNKTSSMLEDSSKTLESSCSQITIAKEKETSNDSLTHIVSILDAAQTFSSEPDKGSVVEETISSTQATVPDQVKTTSEDKESSSNQAGDYKCHKCDLTFVRASQLRTHIKNEHSSNKEEGSHECDQCDAKFSRASQLLQHRQTHKPSDGSTCTHCNEPLYTYQDFRAHHKMHNKTYQCHECGVTFLQKVYLTVHARVHSGEKPFKCNTCPAAFKQLSHLTTHKRTHTHEQPFICASCPARFSQSSSLKRHYRTHTGEKPYVCSVCSSAFSDKRNLTRHVMCHKGIKPYECIHCQAKFSQKIDLHRHNLSHLGVKPFKCSICGVAFSRKNNLLWHERTHDQKTSQQTCAACGIGFSNVRDLKRHYREHNVTKNLSCKLCGVAVSCRFSLVRHMKTHTNNKPFVCSSCPAAFMQLSTLKKHEMRHKGEKNFKCNVCGKAFFDSRCLKRHRVTIHGEERFVKVELEEKPSTFSTVHDQKQFSSQTKNNSVPANNAQVAPKNEVVLSSGMASTARTIVVEASDNGPQLEAVMAVSDTNASEAQTLVLSQPGEPPKTYRLAGNCQNHQNHFITFLDSHQWQAWCICNPQNLPAEQIVPKHPFSGCDSATPGTIFQGPAPFTEANRTGGAEAQDTALNASNNSLNDAPATFDRSHESQFSYTTDTFSSHNIESEANSLYTFTPDGDSYLVQPVCEEPDCGVGNSSMPDFQHSSENEGHSYEEPMHNLPQEDVKNTNAFKGEMKAEELQCASGYNMTVDNPATGSIKIVTKNFETSVSGDSQAERNKASKGNQRKKYQCTVCFKWFLRKFHLTIHMRRHTKEKPYKCTICFALFTHNNTLVAHMRSHTGEKPFRCDTCGVGFAQKSNLTAHMRIHTGEKPYRCDVCHMGFRQASHLPTHRRTHSNERPFACNICTKRFTQNSALKRHMKTHQRGKRNDFTCAKCHENFPTKSELQNHALVHENVTNDTLGFTCTIPNCSQTFPSKKLFDTHTCTPARNSPSKTEPRSLHEEESSAEKPSPGALVSPRAASERHKVTSAHGGGTGKRKRRPRGACTKTTKPAPVGRSSERLKNASQHPKKEKNPEFITGDFLKLNSPETVEQSAECTIEACKTEVMGGSESDPATRSGAMGDWCFCEVPHSADQPHSTHQLLTADQPDCTRHRPPGHDVQPEQPGFVAVSESKNVFSLDQGSSGSQFYAFVDEKGNVMKASMTEILNPSDASVEHVIGANPGPHLASQQDLIGSTQLEKSKDLHSSFQETPASIVLEQSSDQNGLIEESVTEVNGECVSTKSSLQHQVGLGAGGVSASDSSDGHRLLEMTSLLPSGEVMQLVDRRVQIVATVATDGKMQLFDDGNIQVLDTGVVGAEATPANAPAPLPPSAARVELYDCRPVHVLPGLGRNSEAAQAGQLQMLTLVSASTQPVQCVSSDVYLSTSPSSSSSSSFLVASHHSYSQQRGIPVVGPEVGGRPDNTLSSKGYSCPVCGAVERQWRAFIGHVRDSHPDQHMCSVCYRVFRAAADLKAHFAEKHSLTNGGARPCCSECGLHFRDEAELAAHLSDAHRPGHGARRRKPNLKARVIKEDDVTASADVHKLAQSVLFIPPKMNNINSQIVNISGDGDMQTYNSCGMLSCGPPSLHADSGPDGLGVVTSSSASGHSLACGPPSVAGSEDSGLEPSPAAGSSQQGEGGGREAPAGKRRRGANRHTCTFCGEKFPSQCDLERHTLQHTGEKPYACAVCDAAFTRRSSLNNHARKHSGLKPYVCSVCGESFSYRYQLNKHKNTAH